jgi:hypothetical protein
MPLVPQVSQVLATLQLHRGMANQTLPALQERTKIY